MLTDRWFELALALAAVLGALNAWRRGFLREGSLLAGLALALWAAHELYRPLARLTMGGSPPASWAIVLFLLVALLVLVAVAAVSSLVMPLVRRGLARTLDRLAGLALGVAEGALAVGLAAELGGRFLTLKLPSDGPARLAVGLAQASLAWVAGTLPPEVTALAR